MKIAVFGTGAVGTTLSTKLVALGHEVILGSRTAGNEKGTAWVAQSQTELARTDTFAQAARHAELIFNATRGDATLSALDAAGADNLAGKIVIDVTNPLDFSKGMPPTLTMCNDTSLAEQIQAAFPSARVVKTLNTVTAALMVNPSSLPSDTAVFLSGNDPDAKHQVESVVLREWFGWRQIIDLGDITTARGTEMYLPLWIRLWGSQKTPLFNISVVRAD